MVIYGTDMRWDGNWVRVEFNGPTRDVSTGTVWVIDETGAETKFVASSIPEDIVEQLEKLLEEDDA